MNSMMKFCLQISLWFFSLLDVSITKCLLLCYPATWTKLQDSLKPVLNRTPRFECTLRGSRLSARGSPASDEALESLRLKIKCAVNELLRRINFVR